MSWTIVDYHPVSLFSLRPAYTTASGGQTLLAPTAFAVKMAILRASIQTAGIEEGRRRFPQIRDLRIALRLPDHLSVTKTIVRVLRPFEEKNAKTKEKEIARHLDRKQYPFHPTIAYREYVQFGDPTRPPQENVVRVACAQTNNDIPAWLAKTLVAINYLGKRGGFLQAMGWPTVAMDLDATFWEITRDSASFSIDGVWQQLDDFGASMQFEHADVYNPLPVRLGKERVLRQLVLPYRQMRFGSDYSAYERISR